jgi:hypothetical protein
VTGKWWGQLLEGPRETRVVKMKMLHEDDFTYSPDGNNVVWD